MSELWPGLCAAAALVALLLLVIRWQVHAFLALFVVSLGLGLAAGLAPAQVVESIHKGIADILREVLLLLAFGAILGRLLETSGAAELIARRLIDAMGERNTSFAVLIAAFIIGIPILFNVGFLVLIPIVWRLQRETKQSLLYFLMPLALSLGITHSLVPPHPGIVGAVKALAGTQADRVMVETIIFGTLLAFPLALVGWFGPARFWAQRHFITTPEMANNATNDNAQGQFAKAEDLIQTPERPARSFSLALTIILAPLVLSVAGFGAMLLQDLRALPEWMTYTAFETHDVPAYLKWCNHSMLGWLQFLGKPTVALFVPTALALWCYGLRQGQSHKQLSKLISDALLEVGGMVFLFGAAGGFKEVIQATGVGAYLARQMLALPLSPVAVAFCVAGLVRIALGSATAAVLTASALLAGLAASMSGRETLLVLAVACGVTVATQPADSGFWMLKEYGNLSTSDVMLRVNGCRFLMALTGLAILLVVEWLLV